MPRSDAIIFYSGSDPSFAYPGGAKSSALSGTAVATTQTTTSIDVDISGAAIAGTAGIAQYGTNNKDRANSYDAAWQPAWVANAQSILASASDQVEGMFLMFGDSLSRTRHIGRWAVTTRTGATAEDNAILDWMHAGETPRVASKPETATDAELADIVDGFYLQAPVNTQPPAGGYHCNNRSYTVGDGLTASMYLASGPMPSFSDPALARAALNDCATYPGDLNLSNILAGLKKPQFALVTFKSPGPQADFSELPSNYEQFCSDLAAAGIVPIIQTETYRWGDTPPNTTSLWMDAIDTQNAVRYAFAEANGYPLIDLNQELLYRWPVATRDEQGLKDAWLERVIPSGDSPHLTQSGEGEKDGLGPFSSDSDPYAFGGDPATHTTGLAIAYSGYWLKGWLLIQKMKQLKELVVDGVEQIFPLSVSNRYLVDVNNNPFLLHGDTPWSLAVNCTQPQIDQYLDDTKAKGFNAILFNAIEHQYSANAPPWANTNGDLPFGTMQQGAEVVDFTSPVDAYWLRVDYIVDECKRRGIVCMINPAYWGFNEEQSGWAAAIQNESAADLQTYGAFLANRYDQGNVIWCLAGDTVPNTTAKKDKQWNIVTGIRSVRLTDIITAHTRRNQEEAYPHYNNYAGFNLNNIYSDDIEYDIAATAYARFNPIRPFFLIEGRYENTGTDVLVRRQPYAAILSGSCGHFFGHNPLWGIGSVINPPDPPGQQTPQETLDYYLDDTVRTDMQYVKQLFDAYDWWLLEPKTDASLVETSLGTGDNRVIPALASDGSFGMIYRHNSGSVTVKMTAFTPTSVRVREYDPTDGTYSDYVGTPFANTGTRNFSFNKTILVFDAAAGNPTALPLASAPLANPLDWGNFTYAGGFKLPGGTHSGYPGSPDFTFNANRSAMGIAQDRSKMFVGCHDGTQSNFGYAQISIPALDPNLDFDDMPDATIVQGMAQIAANCSRTGGNTPNRTRAVIEHNGMLIGSAQNDYNEDSSGDPTSHQLWRVADSSNITTSAITGYYEMSGFERHAREIMGTHAGEIPSEWQPLLGNNTHYSGGAGPFNRVTEYDSDGPGLFVTNFDQMTAPSPSEPIAFTEILGFNESVEKSFFRNQYENLIGVEGWDGAVGYPRTFRAAASTDVRYNMYRRKKGSPVDQDVDWPEQGDVIGNDLWTNHDRVGVSFIIPGTRTYACFGKADGHVEGMGYRFYNDENVFAAGPNPYGNQDRYNYAWYFDMRDIIDVYNGVKTAKQILPHWHGEIEVPYEYFPTPNTTHSDGPGTTNSGTWDPDNSRLYLAVLAYDGNKPLILAYDYTG